jgi:hypothetical protein
MNFLGRSFPWTTRPTVEEMLAVLDGIGIRLRPTIPVAALFAEASRGDIERGGYEPLLAALGRTRFLEEWNERLGETWHEKWNETRLSDDVWTFLYEAIEGPGSYAWIVHHLGGLTGGEITFDAVRDHIDPEAGVAWAEVERGGATERLDFKLHGDWVDPTILDWFQRLLAAVGSSRQFARYNLGQDDLIICRTPEEIATISKVTRLRFRAV